ncbi:hypothetical protein [Hyphomonas sp.]
MGRTGLVTMALITAFGGGKPERGLSRDCAPIRAEYCQRGDWQ